MGICGAKVGISCDTSTSCCPSQFGCPPGVCADFVIKRHDTKPPLKVEVNDCDGALDLTDPTLAVEASLWAKAKLKAAIGPSDTYFALADNIGFQQAMVGDIIIMHRARLPEQMLVVGFDETNYFIEVQRGYNGTTPGSWKKGTPLRIFRMLNAAGEIELIYQDIQQPDGTTATHQLTQSFLVYEWQANDTCLPGCYWMEFKLLKLTQTVSMMSDGASVTPSFTPSTLTPSDFGCSLPAGVDWVRRFPVSNEAFLISIVDSPTAD